MTTHQVAAPPVPASAVASAGLRLQRKCACGGSCDACQERDEKTAEAPHDFARMALRPPISLSSPHDRYEHEAEQAADAVMRMPAAPGEGHDGEESADEHGSESQSAHPLLISRQLEGPEDGAEDEDERPEGAAPEEEEEEEGATSVAPSASGAGPSVAAPQRQAALSAALDRQAGGVPLAAAPRRFMEGRFGYDFSRVRVHTGDHAHAAARAIGARAFTAGQNIWFARGEFAPDSAAGQRLLAHELTHTIQQGERQLSAARLVQRSTCPDQCTGPVSRGELCRSPEVTRDGCGERPAENERNKISHIRVVLADRQVTLFWNGQPRTAEGTPETFACTPHQTNTPGGWDEVGAKCGVNHTNWKRYNMAWFTAFKSTGMRIGFHNSQPVGAGHQSGGCVRVSCENAEKINRHSSSDWTSIIVR
jgi:hypothetical protein